MDDRLLMRVLHSFAHLNEQTQPLLDRQPVFVAVIGYGKAGNVFHHEIRPSRRRRSGVEDFSYVGMVHQRQGLPLRVKSRHHGSGVHARLD